jgi:hypothetical protein
MPPLERPLIRLVRPPTAPTGLRYPADVKGMLHILNAAGCDADPFDVQWAWEQYSEDEYFAGWLCPHVDDPNSAGWIRAALMKYLVPETKHA